MNKIKKIAKISAEDCIIITLLLLVVGFACLLGIGLIIQNNILGSSEAIPAWLFWIGLGSLASSLGFLCLAPFCHIDGNIFT